MDNNVGMVAVVQGLRDAQLTVTLLDGGRQYTLMPQTGTEDHGSPNRQHHAVPTHSTKQTITAAVNTTLDSGVRCDSCIQVTDGRYASMYQTSHCNVMPTSPPIQLSEFPPQRSELYPGHGNFEVGGTGSGETRHSPTRIPGCYRGGMSWPDRGTVVSPRTSHEPDAFANSLRKYPMLDRSSEMVEKLINYAQSKNFTKTPTRYISPVRIGVDSDTSNQTYIEQNPRYTITKSRYTDDRPKSRADESPTRDLRTRNEKLDYKSTFNKNADVRHLKNMSRRCTQNIRCLNSNINSVSNETQASVEMVSREVATTLAAVLSKKSVATPLSPCTSNTYLKSKDTVSQRIPLTNTIITNKSTKINFQTIQSTSSSLDLLTTAQNCSCTVAKNIGSEKKLKEQYVQDIILEILGNITTENNDTAGTITKKEILKNMCLKLQKLSESFDQNNNKENVFNLSKKLRDVPIWIPESCDLKSVNEFSGDLLSKSKKSKKSELFRAALAQMRINNEKDNIEDVVKDWVNDIPIKSHDFIDRPVKKLQISNTLVRKLLNLFSNKSRYYDIFALKRKIINMMTDVPLNIIASKRHHFIVKLVDVLINKIIDVSPHVLKKSNSLEAITNGHNHQTGFVTTTKKLLKPIEGELTELLFKELEILKENCHLTISYKRINEIIADIIDILLDSNKDLHFNNDNNLREEIVIYLSDTGLFPSQVTNNLAKRFLELFESSVGQTKTKWNNCNFVVLDNTLTRTGPDASLNESSEIGEITQSNIDTNLGAYLNELCRQIDEWLTNLPVKIPQVNEKCLRQDVINDLARDIIDRHRYLELNANHKENDSEELEHLKYQIFKWIKKLVGEEEQETIAHAPDLMKRIRGIPVPMLTIPNQNTNNYPENKLSLRSNTENVAQSLALNPISKVNVINQSIQEDSLGSCQAQSCCNNHSTSSQPSVKELNEEYDEFVKNWVQQIPIPVTNSKEEEKAEKARMGIYNGIWKAVTKLKFDPVVFHNQFYYQDMLDNEIEKLFDTLPKSDELNAKKHLLKVQLIEKTTNMNEMIKSTVERASFKQRLVEIVVNNILKQTLADKVENNTKLNEEPQIINIVENYILTAKYNKEDKVKADFYRNKLLKSIKTLVDELKKAHEQELKNLDPEVYMTDVLNALHKVPLPSDETMKEEEDEILLGIEIDQWLLDLPLAPNDKKFDQSQRRRLRNVLGKKILEIQNNKNISERALDSALKQEISRFLGKIPLQQTESLNINFIIDELRNRLKNMANESRKKSVTFQELPNYDHFDRALLHCSSYIDESERISYQEGPRFCSSYNTESCPQSSSQPGPQFEPKTSEFTEYYPTPKHETGCAPSIIVGGGLANISGAKPNMSASLGQSYINFDQYRPVSSSLRDGGHYNMHYDNQPSFSGSTNQSEPVWLTLEETRNPYYVQPQPMQIQNYQPPQRYQTEILSGSGNQSGRVSVTLKDSESLYYKQQQCQSHQQPQIHQQYESPAQYQRMYVDETNERPNHTDNRHNQDSVLSGPYNNMNKSQNGSSNQDYENLALATSGIVADHAANKVENQSKIVQGTCFYQVPTAPSDTGNISQGSNTCRAQRLLSKPRPTNSPMVANEHYRQMPAMPDAITSETIPYQTLRIPQVMTNKYGSNQTLNNMPTISTPQAEQSMPYRECAQLQVPDGAVGENGNTQYYQSSYGQPQGYSTPYQNHQKIGRESPPKVVKKRGGESIRTRKKLTRRKLELDDSDVEEHDEEECRCLERVWRCRRRFYEDDDMKYSCYMPMPFRYPYFF